MVAPPTQGQFRSPVVLALLALAATLMLRFPAQWGLALAPASLGCEQVSGSVWSGGCRGLRVAGLTLESATWQLHPLPLLRLQLALDLQVDDARVAGHASVAWSPGGHLLARDLRAHLPIDPGLLPLFPGGWGGTLLLSLDELRLVDGKPVGLLGSVHVSGLHRFAPPMEFGDYALRFERPPDANGRLLGQLADEQGPLALSGQLQLGSDGQYELNGRVAARPEAPPELAQDLQVLGPADADGRRPFSLAGSF
jgi:general secretion pathway protein N